MVLGARSSVPSLASAAVTKHESSAAAEVDATALAHAKSQEKAAVPATILVDEGKQNESADQADAAAKEGGKAADNTTGDDDAAGGEEGMDMIKPIAGGALGLGAVLAMLMSCGGSGSS